MYNVGLVKANLHQRLLYYIEVTGKMYTQIADDRTSTKEVQACKPVMYKWKKKKKLTVASSC